LAGAAITRRVANNLVFDPVTVEKPRGVSLFIPAFYYWIGIKFNISIAYRPKVQIK